MVDKPRDGSAASGGLKVIDRRRFTREGEPVDGAVAAKEPAPEPAAATAGEVTGGDERDAKIAQQAARIDELSRAYAALLDDNKAFRQRMEREKARMLEAERAAIAQALLEAADDLERALAATSGSLEREGEGLSSLVDGVRLSLGALQKRIAEIGAVRIDVAGLPFDPRVAEAVDTVPVAHAEQDGMVLHEVRPGYRIGDRVLRPARVRVGRLAQA